MVTQAQIAKKLGVTRQLATFALAGYGKKQGIAVALGNDPKYQQINISPLPGDKENTGGSLEILLAKAGPVPTATTGKMMAVCLAIFHRLLRGRTARLRAAGSIRTDAQPHLFRWNGSRAAGQSRGFHRRRLVFPAENHGPGS